MSSKPLSSLKIPRNILDKLHHHSIYKIQDLITKAPMELVKLLSIPLHKVQLIFDTCFENLVFDPTNALDLIKKNSVEEKLPNDHFDKLIYEIGILRKGLLSEVCGPPGVGKTQLLTQLCITNSLIYPESSIIYIDTENNFSSKRLLEIASDKFLTKEKSEEDLIKMTKNIFVFKKFTLVEFEEILRFLECEIITRNSSLLIIDSLASIVRREYSGSDSSILHERSLFLSKCSSKLKDMAEYLEVSVVLSNQIVSVSNKPLGNNENNSKPALIEDCSVIPALGLSWSHFVNIRLVLQFVDDTKRELLVIKSPMKPFTKYIYYIDSCEGITILDSSEPFDGQNPCNIKIRTKPYST